jgi:hypothetical protein
MTAAGLPLLMGMGGSALPFLLQAGNEVLVVSATDWGPQEEGSQLDDLGSRLKERLQETA